MAEIRMIQLDLIDPPLKPMRQDTLSEGLDELKADLDRRGQMQPIGVVELQDGRYRLVWGSRRTAAAEEMGWTEIMAKVHAEGEINELESMAAENFQRTQLNPVEEASFYAELLDAAQISIQEAARRTHRSETTVRKLLDLLNGDPEVLDALRAGEINKSQAEELNQVKDEIGRRQGLTWARQNLMTAQQLRGWRQNREVHGISENIEQVKIELAKYDASAYKTMTKCMLHNDYVEMLNAVPRVVCDECWDLVVTALNYYHQMHESSNALREEKK